MTAPGLKRQGTSPDTSTIVDSKPNSQGPPSIIISILPLKSNSTWEALVGLGLPDVLALGAAIGVPLAVIRACAILSSGNLIATVSRPPLVSFGTISLFLNIIVKGPGQKWSASLTAVSGISVTNLLSWERSEMCSISGLSEGLPLAEYIFIDAEGLRPSPPKP